ncbi:MAG TPA: rhomboid family intramembrane serine protease [Woeseiaceae bacterium]|nr:rhomboid family intramembrane serine protease [Woeseiaceae bacterium]
MFPIRDENPQITTPLVTYAIIVMNIAAWLLLQGLGSEPALTQSVCQLGVIPGDLLGTVDGAQVPPDFPCTIDGQSNWLTMLTSMFMHGGWMHIIGNMWFLWIFGGNVEDSMGHVRFAIFYVLCGLAAGAAQVFANTTSPIPMVGASGAIGGVMGAYIVLYPRVHVHLLLLLGFYITTFAIPAFWMLGYWILVQFVSGLTSIGAQGGGVAFWAHVGGFAAGVMLVFLFKDESLLARHPYRGWDQRKHSSPAWHKAQSDWRRRR